MMISFQKQISQGKGFIALISAVIISGVLTTLALSVSTAGFYNRAVALDFELGYILEQTARSCFSVVALRLGEDHEYADSNVFIPVGSSSCRIIEILRKDGFDEVGIEVTVSDITRKYKNTFSHTDFMFSNNVDNVE